MSWPRAYIIHLEPHLPANSARRGSNQPYAAQNWTTRACIFIGCEVTWLACKFAQEFWQWRGQRSRASWNAATAAAEPEPRRRQKKWNLQRSELKPHAFDPVDGCCLSHVAYPSPEAITQIYGHESGRKKSFADHQLYKSCRSDLCMSTHPHGTQIPTLQ